MSYNESLSANSNYPPMSQSDWDNAPWNEPVIPEKDFDLTISQSLSKDVTVSTDDYTPEYDDEDGHIYANTDNTEWNKVYSEEHLTPLEIIQECKRLAEFCIGAGWQSISNAKVSIKRLIEECEGWENDETEIFGS